MTAVISAAQLRALQSLCSRVFAREDDPRAARLAWASAQTGREIASFKELRSDEAERLIVSLKQSLGQPLTPRRRPRTREAAEAAGRHGRRGVVIEVQRIAGPDDFARVERMRAAVGMSVEAFETWLRSRSSPLGTRSEARILTVADANRVYWALRAMARRAG